MKKWILLALSGAVLASLSAQTPFTSEADMLGAVGANVEDETLGWSPMQMAADDDWGSTTWRGWFPALLQSFEPESFTLIASTTDAGHDNMWTWAARQIDISGIEAGSEIVISGTGLPIVYEGALFQNIKITAATGPDTTSDADRIPLTIVDEAEFPVLDELNSFELKGILPEGHNWLRIVVEIVLDKVVPDPENPDNLLYGEAELTIYNFLGTAGPPSSNPSWWAASPLTGEGWRNTGEGYPEEAGIGWVFDGFWPYLYTFAMGSGSDPDWVYVLDSGDRSLFWGYNLDEGYWFLASSDTGVYYIYGDATPYNFNL
jgi:hypothetical protein